jgi:putative heme-binding domain-containing protein
LAQTSAPADRAWEHAVVRALVQCGGNPANLKEAWNNNISLRLLLVVMDQSGQMTSADAAIELLDKADAKSMAVARWVLSRHAEWDADVATYVARLNDIPSWLDPTLLGRLSSRAEGRSLLAQWLSGSDSKRRYLAIEAIRQSTGPFPNEWVSPLASMLAKNVSAERTGALNLAAVLARRKTLPAAWMESLKAIANNPKEPIADRLLSMVALPPDNSMIADLVPLLHRDRPQQERQLALEAITRLQPTGTQWDLLAGTLASASPTDIGKILDLFQAKAGVAAGIALAHALEKSEIASSLSIPAVRTIINAHAPAVRSAADPILARLDPGADGEKKRVAKLITELPAGDARRGHAVFNSAKTACAACHKIGYVGGDAGPDLSRIGQIRSRQDLIEAIVAPSVSFVRSYEPVVVTLASGKPVAGVLKSETDAEVVIQTGPTAIERLERRNVESVTPGLVSLMPSGLEKQITAQELADLIAFLLERR